MTTTTDTDEFPVSLAEGTLTVEIQPAHEERRGLAQPEVSPVVQIRGRVKLRGRTYEIWAYRSIFDGEWGYEPSLSHREFRRPAGNDVEHRSSLYDKLDALVRMAIASFANARPDWEKRSLVRLYEERRQHKSEVLRDRQQEIKELQVSIDLLTAKIHELS